MSITATDVKIRAWRISRLSSDNGGLGYPRINILYRCALFGPQPASKTVAPVYPPTQDQRDAQEVQDIVSQMPTEMREAFEAKHLGLIRGQRSRKISHKARAEALGISKSSYWRRVDAATRYIDDWLGVDRWDSCANIQVPSHS